jgi:hypothetical protein
MTIGFGVINCHTIYSISVMFVILVSDHAIADMKLFKRGYDKCKL